MLTQKKWYALYTKARCEKRVAEQLGKRRIENYCPVNKITKQWSDRKKEVEEVLFPSYVFVHASEAEHLAIRQTEGVVNFVYWLGSPAVIRPEEMEAVKDFLKEYGRVTLEKAAVNVSDRVRITDGLLVHREGDVLEVRSKTVRLLLPSLGYTIVAEVSKEKIEVINYTKDVYSPVPYRAKPADVEDL